MDISQSNLELASFTHTLYTSVEETIAALEVEINSGDLYVRIPVAALVNVKSLLTMQSMLVKHLYEESATFKELLDSLTAKIEKIV